MGHFPLHYGGLEMHCPGNDSQSRAAAIRFKDFYLKRFISGRGMVSRRG